MKVPLENNSELIKKAHEIIRSFKESVHSDSKQRVYVDNNIADGQIYMESVFIRSDIIKALSDWRETHYDSFNSQFKVTLEGTRKWMREQVIEKKDKILFLIYVGDEGYFGHMGLANVGVNNFGFGDSACEIDNVIRGKSGYSGLITACLNSLCGFALNLLKMQKIYLRVFSDNKKAIKCYESCGFRELRKIPLIRTESEGIVKYIEIKKESDKADRFFSLMSLIEGAN